MGKSRRIVTTAVLFLRQRVVGHVALVEGGALAHAGRWWHCEHRQVRSLVRRRLRRHRRSGPRRVRGRVVAQVVVLKHTHKKLIRRPWDKVMVGGEGGFVKRCLMFRCLFMYVTVSGVR